MIEDSELIRRWQAGDERAAEELHRRYAHRIWHLAKDRIGHRLGRRIDPDDVVQSVFRTFFRRTREGQIGVICSGALWHLLVKIAVHKLQKSVAYHTAKRRDFREEASLESELADEYAGVTAQDSAAALVAELDELLASLQGREVEIVRLCLQGHSTPEIGVRVGCSRWTVRRVLDLAGTRLVKRLAADQACPVNAQDP